MKNNPFLSKRPLQAIEATLGEESTRDQEVETALRIAFTKRAEKLRLQLKSIHIHNNKFLKMEKVGVDRDDLGKKMESMQKYIDALEENLELRKTLPYHVKRLVTENENLKAEIERLKDAKDIATIRSNCVVAPQVTENKKKAEIQTL